ncbi:hypothetical protein CLHUN_40360 [Ruminiclostridium hungatei]|uniref:Uncharacterized protein n=1 Tax=Ruminiclostridium hungatei TaxID=48256 RepID=A0A1V4SE47_RUMHU|nr:hypothetical protein CLHUN_40360 [Ruminiclostridium hungatei]
MVHILESIEKGKKLVTSIIILILLIDIFTIAITSSIYAVSGMMSDATYKIMQGIFRLLLEGLILFFLYKGHKWAKWLMIVLLFIGGLFSLITFITSFSIIILLMGIVYIVIGIILTTSKSVKLFLEFQKNG